MFVLFRGSKTRISAVIVYDSLFRSYILYAPYYQSVIKHKEKLLLFFLFQLLCGRIPKAHKVKSLHWNDAPESLLIPKPLKSGVSSTPDWNNSRFQDGASNLETVSTREEFVMTLPEDENIDYYGSWKRRKEGSCYDDDENTMKRRQHLSLPSLHDSDREFLLASNKKFFRNRPKSTGEMYCAPIYEESDNDVFDFDYRNVETEYPVFHSYDHYGSLDYFDSLKRREIRLTRVKSLPVMLLNLTDDVKKHDFYATLPTESDLSFDEPDATESVDDYGRRGSLVSSVSYVTSDDDTLATLKNVNSIYSDSNVSECTGDCVNNVGKIISCRMGSQIIHDTSNSDDNAFFERRFCIENDTDNESCDLDGLDCTSYSSSLENLLADDALFDRQYGTRLGRRVLESVNENNTHVEEKEKYSTLIEKDVEIEEELKLNMRRLVEEEFCIEVQNIDQEISPDLFNLFTETALNQEGTSEKRMQPIDKYVLDNDEEIENEEGSKELRVKVTSHKEKVLLRLKTNDSDKSLPKVPLSLNLTPEINATKLQPPHYNNYKNILKHYNTFNYKLANFTERLFLGMNVVSDLNVHLKQRGNAATRFIKSTNNMTNYVRDNACLLDEGGVNQKCQNQKIFSSNSLLVLLKKLSVEPRQLYKTQLFLTQIR